MSDWRVEMAGDDMRELFVQFEGPSDSMLCPFLDYR